MVFMTYREPDFLNVFFEDCLYAKKAFDDCARIYFFMGGTCQNSQQLK